MSERSADIEIIPTSDIEYEIPSFGWECLTYAREAWEEAHDHPFVRALKNEELDEDRFKFYQMQDARYLEAFADTCSIISARVSDPAEKEWLIEASRLALVVERELHTEYGKKLGYGPEDIAALELTPNNRAYQDHMISTALRGSLAEAVAALTPCPWLYVDLGRIFLSEFGGSIPEEHRYSDWLETYTDPAFQEYMDRLLSYLQRHAEAADEAAREAAREAFLTSTRYEWMFWQQAWKQQTWPV